MTDRGPTTQSTTKETEDSKESDLDYQSEMDEDTSTVPTISRPKHQQGNPEKKQ